MTFKMARLAALLLPSLLLGGAYFSEYIGGLYPCEMCWWQRYPHMAAIPAGLLAFLLGNPGMQRVLTALAALALLTSGIIGGFHAGVEYGWWQGITGCTSTVGAGGGDFMESVLNAPLNRCDVAPWKLFGISLAGYNFLLSCGGAIAILCNIWKSPNP
jgi:disulfide bond formation protein DsbB